MISPLEVLWEEIIHHSMSDGKSLAAGIDVSLPFSTGDFRPNHLLTGPG